MPKRRPLRVMDDCRQVPLATWQIGHALPDPKTVESSGEVVAVPVDMIPAERLADVYAVRVRGDADEDLLIADGDVVLLREQDDLAEGVMLALGVGSHTGVTFAQLTREGTLLRLQPPNSSSPTQRVPASEVAVHAQVVGILRTM